MQHALPRRIKLAFVAQALIASVAICVATLGGAYLLRNAVIDRTARIEAQKFWTAQVRNPANALLHGPMFTSYFRPTGGDSAALPPVSRELPAGLQRVSALDRLVYIEDRPPGRFVLVIDTRMVDALILWASLGATLIALCVSYLVAWWTYRTTKRLVVPVSWLADVVARWDPRAPDVSLIRAHNLPADSGQEVIQLTGALTGLVDRVSEFVQRERDFTRDASHELRTPLTVIRVATDLMLSDADLSERQRRSLARVQRAGRDMEAVIDAFLILAREAEIAPLSEEFDAREVIAHEVDRVQPMLVGRPIELVVIDEGAPRLFAPPHVLAVMVGNLLGNAVRFTDTGRIELLIAPNRIEVRDTGIGMSSEALMKAFDPFYRVDPNSEEGRGMGLSIVRRLGERFGWPVSLSSVAGHGTTAVIRFA